MIDMSKGPDQTTILLLVSDPLVRAVTQETLEQHGYVVVSSGDLGTAVDWLRDLEPDLLITRIYVEHMPGHAAARYLQTKRPQMRVLIMSGLLDDERLANQESIARFAIFPKPYSAAEFLKKVREVLSEPRG
jgi:DNA-binding NtrC family response regulator